MFVRRKNSSALSLLLICMPQFYLQNVYTAKNWSYLIFVQRWPPAACLDIPYGKCAVPGLVNDWIIHGLWPTSEKGYPSFCNNSWPFNLHDVKPIHDELEAKWPNIISGTSSDAFWKHEWAKHGTCAASVQELDGILKYFTRSLEFHDSLNVYEILRKSGIVPDEEKAYMLKSIEMVIYSTLKKNVAVFCKQHKDYKYPILDIVYFCMDKKFELIDCNVQAEATCTHTYVTYLPFKKMLSCLAEKN